MFAVLRLKAREKGLKSRIRYLFSEPAPVLERIKPDGCAPFFILTAVKDKNGEVNSHEICRLLGRCAARLLVEHDVILPENEHIALFVPEVFPALMLFNSAVRLISNYDVPPEKRTVAVVDPAGILKERIVPLVTQAAVLKIVTQHPQNYADTAENVLDEWGLPLIVSENYGISVDCDVIIAPFQAQAYPLGEAVLLRNKNTGRLTKFKGEGVTLPPETAAVMPENVDPMLFVSALFELCCATSLSGMCFDKMKITGDL